MLDDRKLDVLKAIVTDYVASREPVGSKALVERHQLKVSAATVRNDMAALEEEGYITQPHTSACGSPQTRATGSSSTGWHRSSRCPRPNASRSRAS